MFGREIDRQTRRASQRVREPPLISRPLDTPSFDNWQAAPPMGGGFQLGRWWDGTDGGRQGNPRVVLHLLYLIDFPWKGGEKPVARMKLLIKRPSD